MIVDVINKIILLIFILSTLNVFRHSFYFAQAWLTSTIEEPKKYIISKNSLLLLGLSISYIITNFILGFSI